MFYEQLNLNIDIEKLRKEVIGSVFPLGDQVIQGKEYETPQYHGFGGWSITTRTGDWKDAWESFQTEQGEVLESLLPTPELIVKALKYFNMAHSLEHNKPTQACVGEIKNVIDRLAEMGLNPRRVRVACLKAGCKSLVHKDADTSEYMARLHIPLWTNQKAVFIAEGKHLHMPADGSAHIIWANIWHQIRNDSDIDRYHLIMDIYDTKHITQYFKYMGDFTKLETFAKEYREQLESVELSNDDVEFFEGLKARYIAKSNMALQTL
jgi:hypothetical protein